MAEIVFTWEIGAGTGHITPYLRLIQQLEAQGHHIFFIVKSLAKARSLFTGTQVTRLQAPVTSANHVNKFPKNSSQRGL